MTATSRRREPAPGRTEQTARDLLALLGGPDNIAAVSYCFTKLRLTLSDRAATDDTGLLAHPAVLGLIEDTTYQVMLGPATVEPVAHALAALLPPLIPSGRPTRRAGPRPVRSRLPRGL